MPLNSPPKMRILQSIYLIATKQVIADVLARYTSLMDENDWDHVLRNCCLLYGWRIDKNNNRIERATTPGNIMFTCCTL